MTIHVKFFAMLRDRAGVSEVTLTLDDGTNIERALGSVSGQFPVLHEAFKPGRIALALNRAYVPRDTILHDGDELALIPPVSGG